MISPEFEELLRGATAMELVALQHEARQVGDEETLTAVLAELKRRTDDADGETEQKVTKGTKD